MVTTIGDSIIKMIGGNYINESEDYNLNNLFLSEDEKYDDDKNGLKKIFYYYENLIVPQIINKQKYYDNNYNIRYGKINIEDYGLKLKNEYDEENNDVKLDFYPIAPNIINTLIQELQRKYYNFFPKAIDSDSINETLELMTEEMKSILIDNARKLFFSNVKSPTEEELSNLDEEQRTKILQEHETQMQELEKQFQALPKIQKYYKTNYKPEIVKWAENLIKRDILKFNTKILFKDIFEEHLVVGERYCHVKDLGFDYIPEFIPAKDCGSIQSPHVHDCSESVAFYWTELLEVQHLISKYGHLLSEDDIEFLKDSRNNVYTGNTFRIKDEFSNNKYLNEVNAHNYRVFENLLSDTSDSRNSIRVRHQYFLVPRKLAKLTIRKRLMDNEKINNNEYKDIVEIVDPDIYISNNKLFGIESKYANNDKILDNLIEGEHLDYFYINEVFYGSRIGVYITNNDTLLQNSPKKDIWLKLEKLDYQGSSNYTNYGTQIPVFGGKINSKTETYISEIDKLKPHQVFYNYLMNRCKSLFITWIAPYYMANQSFFGVQSLEESWQEDSIFKSILAGEENSIVPIDTTNNGTTNQVPQNIIKIDPDRSNYIRTLYEFANLIKKEAYEQIGTSPQFLGQISAQETATGVNAAQNRSVLQLEHLYEEHYELVKKVHQYMLDLAQVKHFKQGGLIEMSYVTTDSQQVIFKTHADNIPLTKKVGIFFTDTSKENENLQLMKQLAMSDNTMGSSAYEKMLILQANSQDYLLDKLKTLKDEVYEQELKRQESISQQQQTAINAQAEAQLAKQKFEAEQNQLDRELSLLETQIQALGRSNNNDQNSNNTFDVSEIMKNNLENQKLSASIETERNRLNNNSEKDRQNFILKQNELIEKKNLSNQNYLLKLKELETKLKISNNQLQQAKENKNKYDKK
jgi:hypothetical protein